MKISILTNVLAAVLAGIALGGAAVAQHISDGPAGYRETQSAGGSGIQLFGQGVSFAGCDTCDAYGNSVDPGSGSGGSCNGGYGGCDEGSGGGCGMFSGFGAFGFGGGYDQCGPHYFDVSADFLSLSRDRTTGSSVVTTSLGIDGPSLLSTGSADFDTESGFRVIGRLDLGPATIVEAIYFGAVEWADSQHVGSETNQLFSLYTDFGLDPFGGVGYEDTDNANLHQIGYRSELHNAEINWRQYWVCSSPSVSGTWLMGARYVRLTEDFLFRTRADGDYGMDDLTSTENDLVGFQFGGDMAVCVLQGFRFVAEGKAGIYNNRVKLKNRVVATTLADTLNQSVGDNSTAFIGEASIGFVADILPSFSIRAGYQVLYIDSLALAADNFSTEDPFLASASNPRNLALNASSDALYSGFYGGLEYIW